MKDPRLFKDSLQLKTECRYRELRGLLRILLRAITTCLETLQGLPAQLQPLAPRVGGILGFLNRYHGLIGRDPSRPLMAVSAS